MTNRSGYGHVNALAGFEWAGSFVELCERTREEALAAGESEKMADRTGVRTTGIVSVVGQHKVALFFTGRQIAGESLEEVLQERLARLPPAIHMADALSHNLPAGLETIVANCLAHGRRHFVDIVDSFPKECRRVLETLTDVYKHDALARAEGLSPQQRLQLHQQRSGPPMKELQKWMQAELDEHRVEPNSPLGEAIRYMLKHWPALEGHHPRPLQLKATSVTCRHASHCTSTKPYRSCPHWKYRLISCCTRHGSGSCTSSPAHPSRAQRPLGGDVWRRDEAHHFRCRC